MSAAAFQMAYALTLNGTQMRWSIAMRTTVATASRTARWMAPLRAAFTHAEPDAGIATCEDISVVVMEATIGSAPALPG